MNVSVGFPYGENLYGILAEDNPSFCVSGLVYNGPMVPCLAIVTRGHDSVIVTIADRLKILLTQINSINTI